SRTESGVQINNPLYEAKLANRDFTRYNEFSNNFDLQWLPFDFLSVKGQVSITKNYSASERFIDPLSYKVTAAETSDMLLTGDLYLNNGESTELDTKLMAYFAKSVGRHDFNIAAGFNLMSSRSESTYMHYRGFPSGKQSSPNYAAEVYGKPTKTQSISRLFGALTTLNYTYANIYLVDASVRVDGSSKFGKDQKWAPFWSAGFGVNIHNYKFMGGQDVVNELRLKASYGETGKTNFDPYLSRTTYSTLSEEWYMTGFGMVLKAMGNNALSWEVTRKWNMGLDLSLWQNRVTANLTYYHDKTVDLVNSVTIPSSNGFTSYSDNLGEVVNKGFEVSARVAVVRQKDLQLNLWGNVAHNKGELVKISESMRDYNLLVEKEFKEAEEGQSTSAAATDPKFSKPLRRYENGSSLTSIWGMRSLGIDPTTGKELFVNRDGSISHVWLASQEMALGDTEPKLSGNFGFNLSYRNFTLYAGMSFEFGGQIYNQTLVDNVENARVQYMNVDKRVLTDRWQNKGDVTALKDIRDRGTTTLPTSRFVQDNNEVAFTTLTLGYDFDKKVLDRIGLRFLRLEVQMNDIARWSSVRIERGTNYPFARQVNFTLRTSF
ncbi:TonB-dependent receptor, partial [Alistipes sp. OttesenSCG-928-B03]|nr:TonB-dependent receptor [Alistipes sp. OttesenSCG-928-B03]